MASDLGRGMEAPSPSLLGSPSSLLAEVGGPIGRPSSPGSPNSPSNVVISIEAPGPEEREETRQRQRQRQRQSGGDIAGSSRGDRRSRSSSTHKRSGGSLGSSNSNSNSKSKKRSSRTVDDSSRVDNAVDNSNIGGAPPVNSSTAATAAATTHTAATPTPTAAAAAQAQAPETATGAATGAEAASPDASAEVLSNRSRTSFVTRSNIATSREVISSFLGGNPLINGPEPASRSSLLDSGLTPGQADIRLVRRHQNEVLQRHFTRLVFCTGVMFVLVFLTGLAMQIAFIVRFIQASDEECNAPLKLWGAVTMIVWLFRVLRAWIDRFICCWTPVTTDEPAPRRVVVKDIFIALIDCVWVVALGLIWLLQGASGSIVTSSSTSSSSSSGSTYDGTGGEWWEHYRTTTAAPEKVIPACEDVHPDLHLIALVYVCFHLGSVVYVWLNIFGLHTVLRILVRRGLLRTSAAAPKGALDENTAPVTLTAEELAEHPTCPICIEDYENTSEVIVKTKSCGHFYHKQCLKNWLNTARTCPICREDLGSLAADKE